MIPLEEFKYGGTNVTAFRLLDPERDELKQVVRGWISGELRYGRKMEEASHVIKVNNYARNASMLAFMNALICVTLC